MSVGVGVVRSWDLVEVEDGAHQFNAASLAKQVIGHLALTLLDDLDEPVHGGITVRHVLSHTTGLPNWRPEGEPLRALRPPGQRWGYSGEGFVLLQRLLEQRLGAPINELADRHVFRPLAMSDSRLDDPEPDFHGNRPLITTAGDNARFLASALRIDDERWLPQWHIDRELAWGAGWGLELGPPIYGWQWGQNIDASGFVIGCPSTGDGVVVLTDLADGRSIYRAIVERQLPGNHPSLHVEHNAEWISLFV
jgi:CubicO group peptidase (beta-lactamase class C family)